MNLYKLRVRERVTGRYPSDTKLSGQCGLIELQDDIPIESRFGNEQLMMRNSKDNQLLKSADPVWDFLAEISLCEILSGNDRSNEVQTGFVFQIAQELGIPTNCAENISMAVTILAREALARFQQGRLEMPGRIRIFCQKKTMGETNSARTASRSDHAEQAMKHAPIIQDSGTIMNGGWGYFFIERSADNADPCEKSHPLVDLYLYKEGE